MTDLPPAIASARHPLAQQTRALARGAAARREHGLFLVEGPRGVAEALAAGAPLVWVLLAAGDAGDARTAPLVERALAAGVPVQPVRRSLFDRIAPTVTSSGLLAACRLPAHADDPSSLLARPGDRLVVVTAGVQDPGNIGTIVRSAAAFGVSALVAAGGADPYHPRAVRAAAGALHRLDVARAGSTEAAAAALARHRFRTLAAVAHGGTPPADVRFAGRVALLFGGEVAGLPASILANAERITIPLAREVESLSVGAAAAIVLERAARQRG